MKIEGIELRHIPEGIEPYYTTSACKVVRDPDQPRLADCTKKLRHAGRAKCAGWPHRVPEHLMHQLPICKHKVALIEIRNMP